MSHKSLCQLREVRMYLVLDKEDFRKNKKGVSFFCHILNDLQVPIEEQDGVCEVELHVESFEVRKSG